MFEFSEIVLDVGVRHFYEELHLARFILTFAYILGFLRNFVGEDV